MKLTVREVLQNVNGSWNSIDVELFENFSIDSRKVKKNGLFFAIAGEKTDGHLFVEDAYKNGAIGAVVEKDVHFSEKNFFIIRTHSVKEALFNLGRYARSKLKGKVIGITGSAGKTTTKEMLFSALNNFFKVSKTLGNANTELSIPLFMLNDADINNDYNIVEMGVQKPGDMDLLNTLANPDFAVLLNAGMSHLEYLKNIEAVAAEKFKLAHFVARKGVAPIVNGDDELFLKLSKELNTPPLFFGLSRKNTVSARIKKLNVESMELDIWAGREVYPVSLPFSGVNFAYDLLATVSVGIQVGIPLKHLIKSAAHFTPISGRGKEFKLYEKRILVDETYNANPISLEYSLSRFKNHKMPLFIILGDMFELGSYSEVAHRRAGKIVASFKPDLVALVGTYSKFTADELVKSGIKNVFYFSKMQSLIEFLSREVDIPPYSVIFVKGSRGMHLEDAVEIIKERFTK